MFHASWIQRKCLADAATMWLATPIGKRSAKIFTVFLLFRRPLYFLPKFSENTKLSYGAYVEPFLLPMYTCVHTLSSQDACGKNTLPAKKAAPPKHGQCVLEMSIKEVCEWPNVQPLHNAGCSPSMPVFAAFLFHLWRGWCQNSFRIFNDTRMVGRVHICDLSV